MRGIDGDNGATPWYTVLQIGSQKQKLNFAFDTGTTYSWVTSARCTTGACLMHSRFKINNSETFVQESDQFVPFQISFGPWGTMDVSLATDSVAFMDQSSMRLITLNNYTLYVAHSYSGSQFENLVWDGAIGIPSVLSKTVFSALIHHIVETDECKHENIKFNYNAQWIEIGTDESHIQMRHALRKYNNPDFEKLWFLNLDMIVVNGCEVGNKPQNENSSTAFTNKYFCVDTGSSRFKGDPEILNAIIDAITFGGLLPTYIAKSNPTFDAYPTISFFINGVEYQLAPNDYFEKISEELYVLGFYPMAGLDNILLAGSVFLEKYNPVFFFKDNIGTHVAFISAYPPHQPRILDGADDR
jgi:saccharopepsin